MKKLTKKQLLILGSFATIYIVWGATYLANRLAIEAIPPFYMAGIRFVVAGLLMFLVARMWGVPAPSRLQLRNAAISGFLFLSVGTGGIVWAEQFIDTGVTALIVALEPLMVVLLLWWMSGKSPTWSSFVGIGLGLAGMALLVNQDEVVGHTGSWAGILVIFISITAWAIASIFVGRAELPQSKAQSAGLQMLTGGFFLLIAGTVVGEAEVFSWSAITAEAWWAWAFLMVFGSIIAFSAFNYLLTQVSPEKVATSTYVNPVVAMFLGWYWRDELISNQSLVAAGFMLLGVLFINSKLLIYRPKFSSRLTALLRRPRFSLSIAPIALFHPSKAPSGTMIARVWHGRTKLEDAQQYIDITRNTALPDCTATPGNLGVTFLHREEDGVMHFTFISYWKNLEAVKSFAGEDYQKARIYPEDLDLLLEVSEKVAHHEVPDKMAALA